MKQLTFLLPVLSALSLCTDGHCREKKNVLLICVDDLNDWIGPLQGNPGVRTPHIDRLAERGVVFANAYCQAPLSGPSRTSFLTGLYPSTTGVYHHIPDKKIKARSAAAARTDFLPDYFERFDYRTMAAGKVFHQGDSAGVFDEYGGNFGIYGPKPAKRINYDPEWFGKPKGTATDWGAFPEREEEMPDYKTVQWAVDKLKQPHSRPFFLAAGLVRPHVPWFVPRQWFELFPLREMIMPPYRQDDMDDVPAVARKVTEFRSAPDMKWVLSENKWPEIVQAYLACVAFMDDQVGKLLKALNESPYRDNTIVVLIGDNGYDLGQKGRFAKQSLWRTSTHVPLIIAAPGCARNSRCEAHVGLIDLYPTLTELCGLEANPCNEGRSIVPLLLDPSGEWDYPARAAWGKGNHAIYQGNMHYIRYHTGDEELYDLKNDPNEWTNLAAKPRYKAQIKRFRQQLPASDADDVSGM
jgi:arylsulfatase A-like enzyme